MFASLFGKKEEEYPGQVFSDKAYISTMAKMKACLELARKDKDLLFIAWFTETARQFSEYFHENGIEVNRIVLASQVSHTLTQTQKPVFTEHYPLHSKELALTGNWQHKQIPVFSALDEPLFKHFGSEKIIPMIKLLGMKENEAIEHSMVSKSILKGQQKIEEQVTAEQHASSQEEWMRKNLG